MIDEKKEVIQEREALIEMYKAGFLDAYKLFHKLKNKKDWLELNKFYKDAFCNRFEKAVKKILKN
jgi:hypothetical protein